MSILIKFGKRVKELRLEKNMTQEELAYKADISVYYVSKLERGKANPSLETIEKVAKALKIKIALLLN